MRQKKITQRQIEIFVYRTSQKPFHHNNPYLHILLFINILIMNLLKASNYRGTNPLLGKILLGTSALTAVLSAYNYLQSRGAEAEVRFRKEQLSKPIYKLSEEEMVNPPWNKDNINDWLYRRVEVTGRPIHRLQCLIPRNVNGAGGFEYVLPLVARENEARDKREGLILSRGFLPYKYRHIGDRERIEDVSRQTFVGFVSQLEELQDHGFLEGNAYQDGRQQFTYANIDDISKTTNFLNRKQASVAVIEELHQLGDLNERHAKRYANDMDYTAVYPWAKTEAGALQLPKMPWDYKNEAKIYFATSIASLIVGASVF